MRCAEPRNFCVSSQSPDHWNVLHSGQRSVSAAADHGCWRGGAGSYDDTKGKVGSGLPGAFLAGGLLNRDVAVTAAHALTADESVLLAHAVIALPFTAHGGSELNANSGTRHFAADGGFGECAKKKAANATNRTAREILMTDAFR